MRDRVTFCIKTIHRPHCCATLVRSIYEHCGDERPLIYVLDDGKPELRFSQTCPDEAAMVDRLIIDEFGFEKLERKEVPDALSLLYKVIDGRNRRSSTAVITNVNLEDWTDYLGDPPMTMALLDRVVDQTNVVTFKGDSIRKPKSKPEK